MIDIATEEVDPLSRAAKKWVPSRVQGRPTAGSTLWRWHTIGILARSGRRIKLEVIHCGGTTCTSREALQRFFGELSRDRDDNAEDATPRHMSENHQRAERELDAI